jgi:hypothetical protein
MAQAHRFPEAVIAGQTTSASLALSTTFPVSAGELAWNATTEQLHVARGIAAGDFVRVLTTNAQGYIGVSLNDTGAAAANTVASFGHNLSSGTPSAGMGGKIEGRTQSTTTADVPVVALSWSWLTSAAHSSRDARCALSLDDFGGTRTLLVGEANGATAKIGFLGAGAIARPSAYAVAGSLTRTFPTDPSSAYSGIDNLQAGSVYAQAADLNALRGVVSSLIGVMRQLVTDLGATSGYGFLNHS